MIDPSLLLCSVDSVLLDVLEVIQKNGKGSAFIVDNDQRVVGILTDGDIRALLLNGHRLQEPIAKLINKNFTFAKQTDSPASILAKTNSRVKILPILDETGRYITYHQFSQEVFLPVASPDLAGNELRYLTDAFLSTWISSTGKYIEAFESEFAKFCGTKYAIAVSNGTTALHVALLALGIGPGDEVIVPDLTFAASVNTVLHAGATPVLVDIEEDSWCIDPKEVEKAITPRTKAIMPVHLYGQPADMAALMALAKKHKLHIIEDAAEAHGASFKKKKVGSWGAIGCFSFYGNKVLTTGEGGMCTTNSARIAATIRKLRDHGMSKTKRYWHDVVGYNYRMTNLQAAIGLAQLERIDSILAKRAAVEEQYRTALKNSSIITFQNNNLVHRHKITWLVSVLTKRNLRSKLLAKLKTVGVDSRPFFYPLSAMPLYKKYAQSTPISHKISQQGFNFPTSSDLDVETLEKIKKVVTSFGA